MPFATYAELQASVEDWADQDVPTADLIALAEASLKIRPELQDEIRTAIALDAEEVTLPTTAREIRSLAFDTDEVRGPVEIVSVELLPEKKIEFGTTGVPRFAALTDNGATLLLAPAPDTARVATIVYFAKLVSLSDDAPTNWLLTNHPNVYLYAALLEAEPYLKNDDRMGTWERKLEKALAEMRAYMERRRFSTTLVMRPRRAIG
jgi:hypothetical protein